MNSEDAEVRHKFAGGGRRNFERDRKTVRNNKGYTGQTDGYEYEGKDEIKFLELTSMKKSQKGSAWTRAPVNLNGWEVTIYPDVLTRMNLIYLKRKFFYSFSI